MKLEELPSTVFNNSCPYCHTEIEKNELPNNFWLDCPNCGKYLEIEYDEEYECECCGSLVESEDDETFKLIAKRTPADEEYLKQQDRDE